MTTESRQLVQYAAAALLVLLGLACLCIYVYDSVIGRPIDPSTSALLSLVIGIVGTVLGINVGSSVAVSATARANENTAAVVQAANGTAAAVVKAHLGVNPEPPADTQQTPSQTPSQTGA